LKAQSLERAESADRPLDLSWELERTGFARIPGRTFRVSPQELALLDVESARGRRKNVSYDPASGRMKGWPGDPARAAEAQELLARFSDWATSTLRELLGDYGDRLEVARASFRPRRIEMKPISWRKDDRRLHLDAFRTRPVQGRRIIRLFANVDPERPRLWDLGEDFTSHAARFLPATRLGPPGVAQLLAGLRVTKSVRTPYDQLMLQLHDLAKADEGYQRSSRLRREAFQPGDTWMAFTDQVPHAVVAGRMLLEHTFHLPVKALHHEAGSPLRILELLTGRRLV
jgi:hypothetical protein